MTKPWHILMILFVASGKGAYWRAYHLATHLTARNHRVTIMTMSPHGRWRLRQCQESDITIIEMPDLLWGSLRSGWDPWECFWRITWLRGQSFDLVHVFDCRPTAIGPALFLRRRGLPLVMDWEDWFGHGGSVEERPNPMIRAVLRPVETFFEERFRHRADATTVICQTLRQKAIDLGIQAETITLVRDGCDTNGLRPLPKMECRRDLGLPPDVGLIGYLGVIFRRDAELMARAFDRIHARCPHTRLLLVGYFNVEIERMMQAHTAVIRTGYVTRTHMNQYLAACDLCWLPLRNSGANQGRWPMKLNDYMSVGKPVVVTAVGDVPEVLESFKIGLLAEDNPEDLADQVCHLLANPDVCTEYGRMARQVAETVMDWRFRAQEVEAVYAKVMENRTGIPL